METTVNTHRDIKPDLLHEEIQAQHPGFKGFLIAGDTLTANGDTAIDNLQEIIEAHDCSQETIEETALRQDEEALDAAEGVIVTSKDPMELLEARIARLEAILRLRLE